MHVHVCKYSYFNAFKIFKKSFKSLSDKSLQILRFLKSSVAFSLLKGREKSQYESVEYTHKGANISRCSVEQTDY